MVGRRGCRRRRRVLDRRVCVSRIHQSKTAHPGLPAYYGDVAAYQDIDAFRNAIVQVPDARERLINQTYVVSGIVQRKYLQLRRGLLSLLVAIVACSLAVAMNVLLSSGG